MRVVVTGGRNFCDKRFVDHVLSSLYITHLIHGCASGADTLCDEWVKEFPQITRLPFPADWKNLSVPGAVVKHGKYGPYNALAGHMRNQRMIDEGKPDFFVAFPGGSGTKDMVKRLSQAGINGWDYNLWTP